MIADRTKKKLQSGQFREGRSGYRKQELFFFWPNDDTPVLSKVLRHFRKMNVQVTRHLNLSHLNNLFSLCEAIPKEQSAI